MRQSMLTCQGVCSCSQKEHRGKLWIHFLDSNLCVCTVMSKTWMLLVFLTYTLIEVLICLIFFPTLFTFTSQVGESSLQSGNLYSPFMKMCRNLYLGGNQSDHGHTFRGSIGGLVLWDYERSHEDRLKLPFQTDKREPLLATWSDFTRVIIIIFL